MISETVTHDLASAEVTDDCRVELWTDAPHTFLFPASARDLAAELVRAADEADKASAELLHPVTPAKFDTARINDFCRDGRHTNCIGYVWAPAYSDPPKCDCSCHSRAAVEDAAA